MKFSRLLEYHEIPEWATYYIEYRYLKRLINAMKSSKQTSINDISESLMGQDIEKDVHEEITKQIIKINSFYKEKLESIHSEIDSLWGYINNLRRVSSLNEVEARMLLTMKEIDDAQNRAVSMQRAFVELHQRVIWLESYAEFNYIGLLKVLSKCGFDNRKSEIESLELRNWAEDLNKVKEDIYSIVADELLNGDKEKAKVLLQEAKKFKTFDIALIWSCVGFWFVMGPVCIYLWTHREMDLLYPSLYFYRFLFMVGLAVMCFAGVILMLEKNNINWLYIFEIPPAQKISYMSALGSGMLILTYCLVIFTFHLATSFHYSFGFDNIGLVISVALSASILFCPFKVFAFKARVEVLKLFCNLAMAPFGEIKFKNYMFGSWTTSMVVPLKDLYITFYFLCSGNFLSNTDDQGPEYMIFFITILPFLWRILQNIKRVLCKKTTFKNQLFNFFRYAIAIGLSAFAYLDEEIGLVWMSCFFIGISLTILLDIKQDFKIDIAEPKNTTVLSSCFLATAIIANSLLRFVGFFTMTPIVLLANPYINSEVLLLIIAVLELIRRSFWSIIRIEREKRTNEENFRDIQYIPKTFKRH